MWASRYCWTPDPMSEAVLAAVVGRWCLCSLATEVTLLEAAEDNNTVLDVLLRKACGGLYGGAGGWGGLYFTLPHKSCRIPVDIHWTTGCPLDFQQFHWIVTGHPVNSSTKCTQSCKHPLEIQSMSRRCLVRVYPVVEGLDYWMDTISLVNKESISFNMFWIQTWHNPLVGLPVRNGDLKVWVHLIFPTVVISCHNTHIRHPECKYSNNFYNSHQIFIF